MPIKPTERVVDKLDALRVRLSQRSIFTPDALDNFVRIHDAGRVTLNPI
jgi:hypothetical protein